MRPNVITLPNTRIYPPGVIGARGRLATAFLAWPDGRERFQPMIVWTVRRHDCQHSLGDEATEVAAWSQFFDDT